MLCNRIVLTTEKLLLSLHSCSKLMKHNSKNNEDMTYVTSTTFWTNLPVILRTNRESSIPNSTTPSKLVLLLSRSPSSCNKYQKDRFLIVVKTSSIFMALSLVQSTICTGKDCGCTFYHNVL